MPPTRIDTAREPADVEVLWYAVSTTVNELNTGIIAATVVFTALGFVEQQAIASAD
jgi:hypothetical protein